MSTATPTTKQLRESLRGVNAAIEAMIRAGNTPTADLRAQRVSLLNQLATREA